jgi:hypothetical protein
LNSRFKHRATKTFWNLYGDLPSEVQKLADRNFARLKLDPFHPSLHFKNIKADVWSARIGIHYRAIAIPEIDGFAWIWIGTHAEYDRLIR